MSLKRYINKIAVFTTLLVALGACDVEEEVYDEALGDAALSRASVENIVAPSYSTMLMLYGHGGYHALQVYSSDEGILPTRQNDWFDGGQFQQLHKHEFQETNPNSHTGWLDATSGIAKALYAYSILGEDKAAKADMVGMLSMFMYITLDLFDQVPYRDITKEIDFQAPPIILKGKQAADVIIANLEAAMPNLPEKSNFRFSQNAAKALMARIYLNRSIYDDRYTTNPDFSNENMKKVVDLTSEIIASGYSLESEDYFKMFDPTNEGHPEFIFSLKLEMDTPYRTWDHNMRLTTNGLSRGYVLNKTKGIRGSDAGCTLKKFLDTFDKNDSRFYKETYPQEEGYISINEYVIARGFLEGQQYGAEWNGDFTYDENGKIKIIPIRSSRDQSLANHTREVNLIAINQSTGVRVSKWGVDLSSGTRNYTRVDVPIFRLAEMYLMRAEAKARMGQSPLDDINSIRIARGGASFAKQAATLNDVYLEWGYEYYWEFMRRTTQIRFGTYEDSWKDKTNNDPQKRIFPIHPGVVAQTPGLNQNPGY